MNCSRCGAIRPERERFCPACGLGSADVAGPDEARFVTVVFCDVAGSAELAAALGPDGWSSILAGYFTAATEELTAGGGRLEKFIGDAVVAVFGAGTAREDEAVRAVRAAAAVRDRIRAEAERLRSSLGVDFAVRLGVASGQVALSPRDSSFAIGAVLNRAVRLQGAADRHSVLIDARTWLLARGGVTTSPVGTVAGKGLQGGLRAWRGGGVGPPAPADPRPPFVGSEELRTQLGAYLRAGLTGGGPVVAVVTGAAGVGTSDLIEQCHDDLGRPERIVVRCAADGSHHGIGAVLALARQLSTVDTARGRARPLTEVHWEIRTRLRDAVQRHPVLLVVDDVHWASPALLDLLQTVGSLALPRFAIVLGGRTGPDLPTLDPVARTFTVPGAIGPDGPDVPAETVAARVDDLPDEARPVLAALCAFGGEAAVEDLTAATGAAVEEPVARLASGMFVDLTARLVRCIVPAAAELAYHRLPAARRAALHGHIARSLRDRMVAEPAAIERVAHHAVQAHDAAPGSASARLAAWTLCDAARFAMLYGAAGPALAYLRTAGETGCDDPAAMLEVAAIEAYAQLAAGRASSALTVAEAALDRFPSSANRSAAADLMLTTAATTRLVGGGAEPARIARARTLAGDSRDPAAIARSLLFQAHDATGTGDYRTAERTLLRAVDLLAGVTGALSVAEIHGNLALCLAYSDQPAARARETCERLHRAAGPARTLRAAIGGPLAYLHHMDGDGAGAQALLNESARVCAELGYRSGLAGIFGFSAAVAEREGDLASAIRHLSRVVDVCRAAGLDDVVRSAMLRRDVLVSLARGTRPAHVPDPAPRASWRDEVARHQLAALHHGDATRLAPALQVLDAVRGSGAVVAGLLTCVRVARRLAASAIAGDCAERLRTAARTKADTYLLETELFTPETRVVTR